MLTSIKSFITFLQKSANNNSLFGGNSTTEGSEKMENDIIKTTETFSSFQTESDIAKEIDQNLVAKNEEVNGCEPNEKLNKVDYQMQDTTSEDNACEMEDDIEDQIESSIMLKRPVKVAATNSREILELKKSAHANGNIVISHDFNCNQALSPIVDELEDFRFDPMAVLSSSTSHCPNKTSDDFCSIGSSEDVSRKDFKILNNFPIESDVKEIDGTKTNFNQSDVLQLDLDDEVEKDVEQNNLIDVEDETLFDLNNFKDKNVIVLDDMDLSATVTSVDTNNTSDDPLAIPFEEQEAFATDKIAVLEELNLLNNSQASQDEDTQTIADEDLDWLKSDRKNNLASCSKNVKNSDVSHEKEERNGEGSDSGLGSETSTLHTTITSITDNSDINTTTTTTSKDPTQIKSKDIKNILSSNVLRLTKSPPKKLCTPYRSNLKRRVEDDNGSVDSLANGEFTSSLVNHNSSLNSNMQKKPKRSINFDTVEVYYFPRQQGYSCVPSAGGCTLGMGARHIAVKTMTLAEHAAELRRAHRLQLQESQPRGSSSDDSEESEEDYLSEGSGSDLDGESNGFLQPVSPKQRRALLKAAGIRKIDPSEKVECRNIRTSREVCGCTCRDFCDPETCACTQSGIKCQVDRDMFPCGCSRDACGNTIGRVEFNPARVRTHYIHTLMRLEMENRQQNPYSSTVASPMPTASSSYYQNHLQQQPNYSSSYASPSFNTESEIQQQSSANLYYHSQKPSSSNILYGTQAPLEIIHNSNLNVTTVASHYGIDSLDPNLLSSNSTETSLYRELISVPSYRYGDVQPQVSPYNTYHNTSYINAANCISTSTSTSNTYSSCSVPSIPPFGTATTTEASGSYHSISSLARLETTIAPSCTVNGVTSIEKDESVSFINLSTSLTTSSRLLEINDLLQYNRSSTTVPVVIPEIVEDTEKKSVAEPCRPPLTDSNFQTNNSLCPAVDAHQSFNTFEELEPPLKAVPQVTITEDYHKLKLGNVTAETLRTSANEALSKSVDDLPSLLNSTQTALCEDEKKSTALAVCAAIEAVDGD